MADEELRKKVEAVLDERIKPGLAAHGGTIALKEVKDGKVHVELGGGCQGCAMARMTIKEGVERIIKEAVPEVQEVVDVSDHDAGTSPYQAP